MTYVMTHVVSDNVIFKEIEEVNIGRPNWKITFVEFRYFLVEDIRRKLQDFESELPQTAIRKLAFSVSLLIGRSDSHRPGV